MNRFAKVLVFCALLAGCGSQPVDAAAILDTPCMTVSEIELPDDYIAADVSPNDGQCWFILQREGAADTTVIAGELWKNSRGNSFDDFVGFMEAGLSVGQEPDLLPLQLLNTGPTGRDLPIIDRIDLDRPNRATIFIHDSDRRDGYQAMSAVVDVNTTTATETTVIFMWGLVTEDNLELFPDLIDALEIKADFVAG